MTFIVGQHRKFVLAGHDTLDPTKVTGSEQILPLGYLWTSLPGIDDNGTGVNGKNQGTRTWIYIKANANITAGQVVQRRDAIADYIGQVMVVDAPAASIFGVAQYDIAANEYGFILREGITETLELNGAVTDGTPLMTATGAGNDGKAEDFGGAAGTSSRIIGLTIDQANAVYRIDCRG
tara:strand:- start:1453 stop:1989 length:537 start_codon:yes stop_codon:yes gene_type:complete